MVKCPVCNGTGHDEYHKEEECLMCDGTGEIGKKAKVVKKARKKKSTR